jgi:hypothetical protein
MMTGHNQLYFIISYAAFDFLGKSADSGVFRQPFYSLFKPSEEAATALFSFPAR